MTPSQTPIGILITNVGTPDDPSPPSVRRYLKEFLSDRRVIDYPRWLWLPILHGIILNTRPPRSAQLYRKIWADYGSPLLHTTEVIARKLERKVNHTSSQPVIVRAGMRYGNPSIGNQLEYIANQGTKELLVLPLFPQYSSTTTGSTYDSVFSEHSLRSSMSRLTIINHYFDNSEYLSALSESINAAWTQHGKTERLLFSFHGIPQRYAQTEPYVEQCRSTAERVAALLSLSQKEWLVAFQSRFGPEEWVKPYTDETLEAWGQAGIESVSLIAPGFAADCLETIDELGREAKEIFHEAGGGSFLYIPALNDSSRHIQALADILSPYLPK